MNKNVERLYNGVIKENPTFVLLLGMCPTLAVTTSAINGLGMGLSTLVVLALSNAIISLLRNIIPDRVRIPAFIVVIASFVTVIDFLLEGFIPSLYSALGLYIPLIVVNCIILGRAESYASKNPVIPSLFDGLGMGLGFTCALTIIGAIRELIGAGTLFGARVMPAAYEPVAIFIMAPGAFFVLAALTAIQNKLKARGEKKGKDMSKVQSGCGFDCASCSDTGCEKRFFDEKAVPGESVAQGAARREAKAEEAKDRTPKAEEVVEEAPQAEEVAEEAPAEAEETTAPAEEPTNEQKDTDEETAKADGKEEA